MTEVRIQDLNERSVESGNLITRRIPPAMAFMVNLVTCAVESIYLWWVLSERAELETFLLLHGGIFLLLGAWHYWCRRTYGAFRLSTFTLVFVTALGPAGALGMAYAIIAREWFLRHHDPFAEVLAVVFQDNPSQNFYERLIGMDPSIEIKEGVTPLMDVISHGSLEQKQAAIVLMAQKFVPAFTPVLKKALKDPNNKIRHMAASAIEDIKHRMAIEASELEQDHLYRRSEESRLFLAIHYDQYAWSGLLKAENAQACREKALTWYEDYLKHQPRDIAAIRDVGRLHYRSGRLEEAASWFETHAERGKQSTSFLNWQIEVLYELGRFADVRDLVKQHASRLLTQENLPRNLQESLELWHQSPLEAGAS